MSVAPPDLRRVILAFAPGPWGWPHFAGSPRYHLWTLAGLGWTVLYVEPPRSFRARGGRWSAPDRAFHVLSPARVAPFAVRLCPTESLGDRWRRFVAQRLWMRAQEALGELYLKPTVCWLGAPWHAPLAERARTSGGPLTVAHVYDELSASPALSTSQRRFLWDWERELLRHCDLALCSSQPQLERRAGIAARTMLLENAVSEAHFAESLPAADDRTRVLASKLATLPKPRLVYGGVADLRLDPAIFDQLAAAFAGGSLCFAGHVDRSFPTEVRRRLEGQRNVHFFGDVPYGGFAHLYAEAEVLLLGHRRSEFTDAMLPEKLNEYLASGRPIVAVDLPEVRRLARESTHARAIRVAATPADFVAACAEAAAEGDDTAAREARIALARRRTWGVVGERLHRELELQLRERGVL